MHGSLEEEGEVVGWKGFYIQKLMKLALDTPPPPCKRNISFKWLDLIDARTCVFYFQERRKQAHDISEPGGLAEWLKSFGILKTH